MILVALFIAGCSESAVYAITFSPLEVYSQKFESGNCEYTYISEENFNKISVYTNDNKNEAFNYILDKLEIPIARYSSVYKDLLSDPCEIGDIIFKDSYCIVDTDGNCVEIPKKDCLKAIEKEKKKQENSTNAVISVTEETTSENGYMRISTSAICHKKKPVGTYGVIATFQWLNNPITREKDAVSLSSTGLLWENVSEGNYSFIQTMKKQETDNSGIFREEDVVESTTTPTFINTGEGLYFEFHLPINSLGANGNGSLRWGEFAYMVSGYARVRFYNQPDQLLALYAKYAHVQIRSLATIDFGWSIGSDSAPGVTISKGALIKNYYYNYLCWDYKTHYGEYTTR